ncbi:MAG: hypothetical protein RL308_1551, partial [Bacteroidota bacterium]
VINRLVARLRESTISYDTMELDGDPQSEFINKEFENMLAGFTTTINITVANDINKC